MSGRLSVGIELEVITNFYILDALLTRNWAALRDALWHIIMPGVTLSTIPTAIIARMTRSSMLEVLRQDYIKTAKAKGLSQFIVIYKHALRNALIPVVTGDHLCLAGRGQVDVRRRNATGLHGHPQRHVVHCHDLCIN
jgi:peptide/nickel transport system permease protein